MSNITGSVPYMTVQHFTGSRSDIEVQYVEITGECEGYTDTAVITRVLDGFGGINYFIKSYNGNEIRNSSTQSLELQAYVVDGVNVVNLNSTSIKGRSNYKLHVLSGSKLHDGAFYDTTKNTNCIYSSISIGNSIILY